MAISTEVLNTTYRQLKGPLIDTFMRRTVLLDTLMKEGRVRQSMDGGSYIERALMTGSPATGRGIYNGTELLSATRTKRTEQLQVEPHRLAAAISIPNRELAQNNGPLAVMKLIEKYPEAFMNSFNRVLESYILSGAAPAGNHAFSSSSMYGITPLNGAFNSGTLTGTTNGMLDFQTKATQNSNAEPVFTLEKNGDKFWYNQYESVSNWNTNGLKKLGKVIRRCGHFSMEGAPDLGFLDPDTMVNLEDSKRGQVRVSLVDDKQEKSDLHTITHNGVTFHESLDLDRTLSVFSGQALADGGGYILNPAYFEFSTVQEAELCDFIDMIATQDVVVSKFAYHAGFICTNLVAQGCISGTAL
jgi:hypothetical protein